MSEKSKRDQLTETLEQYLDQVGFELVLMQYRKEGQDWVLRLFADHRDGMSLSRCEELSHRLSEYLDEKDLIPHAYHLEISSPGIDRPLVKPQHFLRFIDQRVRIKLLAPVSGTRTLTGQLTYSDDTRIKVTSESDGETYEIGYKNIAKATLKPILEFC